MSSNYSKGLFNDYEKLLIKNKELNCSFRSELIIIDRE